MINDPHILFSIINMKLRNTNATLEEICDEIQMSLDQVNDLLNAEGFYYVEEERRYK